MNTNWSSPKTNFFSGLNCLRSALNSGYNAKLVREYNENCAYPIKESADNDKDFRHYSTGFSSMYTFNEINNDLSIPDFQKYLMLNYIWVFGKKEAADHYYQTGEVSVDNFQSAGVLHNMKVSDMVDFYEKHGNQKDKEWIKIYKDQYITIKNKDEKHFYNSFTLGMPYNDRKNKKFNRKLWVVVLLDKTEPKVKIPVLIKILNVLAYPLKYIPQKSVLKMGEYKNVTFRVGGVTNGFRVEFLIPKKFSFK